MLPFIDSLFLVLRPVPDSRSGPALAAPDRTTPVCGFYAAFPACFTPPVKPDYWMTV
jgi:hypothetical protein